jgi:short-subunit dehydrogenase
MKILLTGASSGIGKELHKILSQNHTVMAPTRQILDLENIDSIVQHVDRSYDMLIACAGTGLGGKINFVHHDSTAVNTILQTNLIGTTVLTQKVLSYNPLAKIVVITSTNNNRFYPGDLVYSLSKKSLQIFIEMIRIEYPDTPTLEVKLGLTKTGFNQNRYRDEPLRYQDIYLYPHLDATKVATTIYSVLFDDNIKSIEISP